MAARPGRRDPRGWTQRLRRAGLAVALVCLASLGLGLVEVFTRHGGSRLSGAALTFGICLWLALWLVPVVGELGHRRWVLPGLFLVLPALEFDALDQVLLRLGQLSPAAGAVAVWLGAALVLGITLFLGHFALQRAGRWGAIAHLLLGSVALILAGGYLVTLAAYRTLACLLAAGATSFLALLLLYSGHFKRTTLAAGTLGAALAVTLIPSTYHGLTAIAAWLWLVALTGLVNGLVGYERAIARPRLRWLGGAATAGFVVLFASHQLSIRAPDSWLSARGQGLLSAVVHGAYRASDFDGDGHGFLFSEADCEPFDARVHGGHHEIPANGRDDNCRGGDFAGSSKEWLAGQLHRNPPPRPYRGDIALVVVDALRYDDAMRAQNRSLRALAQRGVMFERAYSSSTHTCFALLALFDARLPAHAEVTWVSRLSGYPTKPPDGLIPTLRAHGYDTAFVGGYGGDPSVEELGQSFAHGSRQIHALSEHAPPSEAVRAASVLWQEMDANKRRFLYVHLFWAHRGYTTRAEYQDAVLEVDRAIGKLVDLVGEQTLFIVTADHGEEYNEHGGRYHSRTLYDEVVHVPLILAGGQLTGRRVTQVSPLLAFFPTMAAMVAGAAPDQRGPFLCVDQSACRDLPVPMGLVLQDLHLHGLIEGQHKAIRNLYTGRLEVYDLARDPGEQRPLSADQSEVDESLSHWEESWFGDRSARDAWRLP